MKFQTFVSFIFGSVVDNKQIFEVLQNIKTFGQKN